ncbi:MAG: helix-turn-helix transcriptional regulator [Phascolarctobacterium sp.]|nr:helix-turn-helix transcriptional regulator [Phascolarctobacterium sp.]
MAKELNYKEMGLRIKTLRLKNNIYQTVLAKEIGVSQTHMSNIESGRAGLTLENLVKMARIFNCGIDEIVFGEDQSKKEQSSDVLKNCTMEDILQALQMLKTLKA